MGDSTPHEILQHLMESSGTRQVDLVGIIGFSGVVSEVVQGKRSISKAQACPESGLIGRLKLAE